MIVSVAGGLYWKIRSDAIASERARQQQVELERIRDAIRAGDAVVIDPERLRDKDRFGRD
jgi:ribosomal protein L18E